MIALKGYARLEGPGIWRPGPQAQRRDVVVSFGEASLIISDKIGRPLAHWSLPAISRVNPGRKPALYSPDEHEQESLELSEDTLIEALETIGRALDRKKSKPGRLRGAIAAAGLFAVLALGFFWLPGALLTQAQKALRPASLRDLDKQILAQLNPLTGPACVWPDGRRAAQVLRARLDVSGALVIVPGPLPDPIILPGGTILLDRQMIERSDDPAVAAGYVLEARQRQPTAFRDTLLPQGIRASFHLLTNGMLERGDARGIARRLASRPAPSPEPEALARIFTHHNIAIDPWAKVAGVEAYSWAGPSDKENAPPEPIMTDAQWVALQNICSDTR